MPQPMQRGAVKTYSNKKPLNTTSTWNTSLFLLSAAIIAVAAAATFQYYRLQKIKSKKQECKQEQEQEQGQKQENHAENQIAAADNKKQTPEDEFDKISSRSDSPNHLKTPPNTQADLSAKNIANNNHALFSAVNSAFAASTTSTSSGLKSYFRWLL